MHVIFPRIEVLSESRSPGPKLRYPAGSAGAII